jgi:6-pyruvoyltetrahydropterin/6-carboxytetrahydropterin synthase
MFEVAVDHEFSAGHALRGYKGKCENVHGHNYKVQVVVSGETLDSVGLLLDFKDLRSHMLATVEQFDHQFMNEIPPFDQLNPSAENLAQYFYETVKQRCQGQSFDVKSVTIWESTGSSATYYRG